MKEMVWGALVVLTVFCILPSIASADIVQSDASTSTPYIASSRANYQTLGTGLSGTITHIDISYTRDTTYYGVGVTARIEECLSDDYGICTIVSTTTPAEISYTGSSGIQSIDLTDYTFDHCKYYRIVLTARGPFGSMGPLRYHGSDSDTYTNGTYTNDGTYGGNVVDDLYFVLHGLDRLDRSANTPENLCVDPVIIVPGLLGSFEKDGVLLMDPILHAYDDMVATFLANGYVENSTLFTFPYDWRNSNVNTAILLKQKIDEVKGICDCSRVDIVAHSMGGLITRQYVQSDTYGYDVDQVVFLATPHLGSPKAYLAWEGGAFPVPSISDAVVYAILRSEAKHSGFSSVFDYIKNRPIASIKELLPIYSYKKIVDTNSLNVIEELYPTNYPTNTFLESLEASKTRISRVRVINMIGNINEATVGSVTTASSTNQSGRWQHGEPVNLILGSALNLIDGDKTVPVLSAEWIGADKVFVAEHTNIPDVAISDVYSSLSRRSVTTLIQDENNPDSKFLFISILSPIDVFVVAPNGNKTGLISGVEFNEIPGAFYTGSDTENEFIVVPNPLDGEYKIETVGTSDGEYTIAVSSISGDVVTETEYTGVARVGDVERLVFDVDISSPSPNLAIAPYIPQVLVEVPSVAVPTAVAWSGGGGSGRRSTGYTVPAVTTPATSTVQNTVNPDTFMITLDVPVDRFVALMTNPSSRVTSPPVRPVAEKTQSTGVVSQTQVASVISAVDGDSSESGFVGKIKEGFKKLFYRFKDQ